MGWAFERAEPNQTSGVTTRHMGALIAKYRRHEVNDDAIKEVLANIHVSSVNDGCAEFMAPELQHSVDSFQT